MSADIVSKNLYELLGNDHDQDSDREPEPPTRAIDKPVARSGKRDVGPQAPAEPASGFARRGGRGGATGNERAFRDREAGTYQNRSRGPEDGARGDRNRAPRGGSSEYRGRGRGGQGGRGRGRGGAVGDRADKTGQAEHQKQVAHGWGGPTGNDELADEKAGEAIAKADEADGDAPREGEDEEPAEPEGPKSKSYEEYLQDLAEKKNQLGGNLQVRKPNEGVGKKFPEGKAFARNEEEENYFLGSGGKAARYREKKEKQAIDMSDVNPRHYLAEDRSATRGGRGRGGDRGGDRGDRGDRDGGRGRGEFRGGRGGDRAPRGEFRGGRGARGGAAPPRADDSKAFPSLGA